MLKSGRVAPARRHAFGGRPLADLTCERRDPTDAALGGVAAAKVAAPSAPRGERPAWHWSLGKGRWSRRFVKAAALVDAAAAAEGAAAQAPSRARGGLTVRGLRALSLVGPRRRVSAPSVTILVGDEHFHTEAAKDRSAPAWRPECVLDVDLADERLRELHIEVFDTVGPIFRRRELLGRCRVPLGDFARQPGVPLRRELQLEGGAGEGRLELEGLFVPEAELLHAGAWRPEQSFPISMRGGKPVEGTENLVQLPGGIDSVRDALQALNTGTVTCAAGLAQVYSASQSMHFAVYRGDKSLPAAALFSRVTCSLGTD